TPATAQPADDSDLTLTFTPNKGYRVAAVSVDGTPLDSKDFAGGFYTLKNITKDIVVHVAFAQIPVEPEQTYTVTSSVTGGYGKISPEGTQEVAAGKARPFTFVPETGWVLDTVLVNDKPVTPDGLRLRKIRRHPSRPSLPPLQPAYPGRADQLSLQARCMPRWAWPPRSSLRPMPAII
ncbi:MAG: hypothetical protein RR655_08035, partial [Raoultibacter sp.]